MLRRPHWLASVVLAAALVGCDGPGNSGKLGPDPDLVRVIPWLNGVVPAIDATGAAVVPDLPSYPPIAYGLPDVMTPATRAADCAVAAGLEFSTGWFDSFELVDPKDATETTGLARGWATYDDLSKYSFHSPGDATWYPGLSPGGTHSFHGLWGLPAEKFPGPSCAGEANDWVLHFRGGLFRKWGAGLSHAFMDPIGQYRTDPTEDCTHGEDFCPPKIALDAKVDTAGLPAAAKNAGDPLNAVAYQQSHDFFDVSKYEGVAFWARRGPEGFDRLLVILTDKYNSGRLARENQQFCRRVRECHTRCLSGSPCAPDDPNSATPIYRCFDPALTPDGKVPPIAIDSQMDQMFPRCGASACTSPTTYTDPDFDGKACRPYAYPASEESGEYCWNPGDPPPPGRDERCQDGWQASVTLTPDWKFYALPFSLFQQAGFGKRAPHMDLKSLDTMAFGALMGWSDMYFDNVTLYRRK